MKRFVYTNLSIFILIEKNQLFNKKKEMTIMPPPFNHRDFGITMN